MDTVGPAEGGPWPLVQRIPRYGNNKHARCCAIVTSTCAPLVSTTTTTVFHQEEKKSTRGAAITITTTTNKQQHSCTPNCTSGSTGKAAAYRLHQKALHELEAEKARQVRRQIRQVPAFLPIFRSRGGDKSLLPPPLTSAQQQHTYAQLEGLTAQLGRGPF